MDDLQDPIGGKRKYKENPLTAKAETGSLKIKIMRKGEGALGKGLVVSGLSNPLEGYVFTNAPRSPSVAPAAAPALPPQPLPSPPKPRANRKHVPIFYQRPNAFDMSASTSTSTDENVLSVTSEYDALAATSTASSSSTTGQLARLDIAPGLPGSFSDPMPLSNPLFTRGMSETSGSLTDLLRTVLPSAMSTSNGSSYSDNASSTYSSASTLSMGTDSSSQSSLLNPAAALRQLASSSAAYSTQQRHTMLLPSMSAAQTTSYHTEFHNQHDTSQAASQTNSTSSTSNNQSSSQSNYRFDAMSALQNAVKIAVATSSPTANQPTLNQQWLSNSYTSESDENDLGPPPSAPPGLSVQHSLVGGGIEAQQVIPTINTVNFNWNRYHQEHPLQPRAPAASIPSVAAEAPAESSTQSTVQ